MTPSLTKAQRERIESLARIGYHQRNTPPAELTGINPGDAVASQTYRHSTHYWIIGRNGHEWHQTVWLS